MIVVNLFGGASSGKSTTAMLVAGKLKEAGYRAEYVPESIKSMIWDKNEKQLQNQVLITAMHEHAIRRLLGSIDIVVTDSPIVSGFLYNKALDINDPISSNLSLDLYKKYNNINFLLPPRETYNPEGRFKDTSGIQKRIYEYSYSFICDNVGLVFKEDEPRDKYASAIFDVVTTYYKRVIKGESE